MLLPSSEFLHLVESGVSSLVDWIPLSRLLFSNIRLDDNNG